MGVLCWTDEPRCGCAEGWTSQCYVPQDDAHRAYYCTCSSVAAARDSCKRVARMGLQVPIRVLTHFCPSLLTTRATARKEPKRPAPLLALLCHPVPSSAYLLVASPMSSVPPLSLPPSSLPHPPTPTVHGRHHRQEIHHQTRTHGRCRVRQRRQHDGFRGKRNERKGHPCPEAVLSRGCVVAAVSSA